MMFFCIFLCYSLNAQNSTSEKTITGVIHDEQTGESLPGASIIVEGTTIGTVSDAQGNFRLSLPANVNEVQISFVGYVTQKVTLDGTLHLVISLSEDSHGLSEVVVIGYGSQKKETLTGAISVVGSKELVQSPTANISNALVGRLPGVSSVQASGEPGYNTSTIRIRGVATLNTGGHDPLVVIDGIEATNEQFNSLDPNDIQNISILKDASSTAVYGVRGANGVIIITTKRGDTGAPKINVNYRFGISQVASKIKFLDSYNYALFRNEAIKNDGDPNYERYYFTEDDLWKFKNNRDYTDAEIDQMVMNGTIDAGQANILRNSPALYYSDQDKYNLIFGGNSPQQQLNVNISGGGEHLRYFTSVGYFTQDGIFSNTEYAGKDINSSYNRYNIRSNLDVNVIKNLTLSVSLSGQFEKNRGIEAEGGGTSQHSRYKQMLNMFFWTPPWNPSFPVDEHGGRLISGFVSGTHPFNEKGNGSTSVLSYLLSRGMNNFYTSNLSFSINPKYDMGFLTKGLTISGTFSYNDTYRKGFVEYNTPPSYTVQRNPENPLELIYIGGVSSSTSITDMQYQTKRSQIYIEGRINYDRKFGNHAVTGMILYNARRTKSPGLQYNVPEGLLGLAGRVTYDFDSRYLAEINIGYNGSENFPKGKRFGLFPALSLGWIVSNESFFPQNEWITWLKFRGSYGEVGSDRNRGDRFLYNPNVWQDGRTGSYQAYWFGNSDGTSENPRYSGAIEGKLGNPEVTWERAKKMNIGAEIRFFSNRLSFTGDLFQEKRDNILWTASSTPSIIGVSSSNLPLVNIGKVSNKGFEMVLSWKDGYGDFRYGISGNVSYARNTVDYMDEPENPHEWMNSTGFSMSQYKGLKSDGFYNTEEEVNNRPFVDFVGNKVQVGDIRYVDINNDGIINDKDHVPIGYSNLPRYTFGGNIDLSWKGFSISALFTGSYKGSMAMYGSENFFINPFIRSVGAALDWQYEGRWTPEKAAQGIKCTFPRASMYNAGTQNAAPGQLSDFWLRSTEFLKLKNLEISYSFNNLEALKRIGLSSARIYINGNNLYTWFSKLEDGFDPEVMDTSYNSEGFLYPPLRSYNIGISIQF